MPGNEFVGIDNFFKSLTRSHVLRYETSITPLKNMWSHNNPQADNSQKNFYWILQCFDMCSLVLRINAGHPLITSLMSRSKSCKYHFCNFDNVCFVFNRKFFKFFLLPSVDRTTRSNKNSLFFTFWEFSWL